jgi:hypothetical protein
MTNAIFSLAFYWKLQLLFTTQKVTVHISYSDILPLALAPMHHALVI